MEFIYELEDNGFGYVPVVVKHNNESILLRALVDSGADSVYIDRSIADLLMLSGDSYDEIGAAGGSINGLESYVNEIEIMSPDFRQGILCTNVAVYIIYDLGEAIILGSSFFLYKLIVTFDYIHKTLTIKSNEMD